jgi:alkaline phosphatase
MAVASPARATIDPATSSGPPASNQADAAVVTLIAAGDIGRCDSTLDDATGALAASLPGVVATLGDTAYPDGTTQQLEECFGGSWGGVKDRIRFAVTGNHDLHTDGGEPLQAYMGSAVNRDGHPWFSDDLGAWHVAVLDGDCGLLGDLCGSESDQVRWLREDLATSDARCTIALMHQPRFSSGDHGDDRALSSFWDELYAADAELVLAGHDHDYERFAPQAPDGTPDDAHGVVEIIVGTGGADLEGFKEARPNSLVRLDDAHGVIELTLRPDAWSFRFVDIAGAVRDAGGGTCH